MFVYLFCYLFIYWFIYLFIIFFFCGIEIAEEEEVSHGRPGEAGTCGRTATKAVIGGYVEALDEGVIRGTHLLLWKYPRPSQSSLTLTAATTALTIPHFNKPQDFVSTLLARKY